MTVDTEVQRLVKAELDREQAARLEQIRQQVLERRAAEQAQTDRATHIADLRTAIAEQLDPAPIDAAEAELGQALERYMLVCADHDRRHSALWTEVSNLAGSGPIPDELAASHTFGGLISSGGVDYRKSRLHTRLIRTARAVLQKVQPLDYVDFSRNPQD